MYACTRYNFAPRVTHKTFDAEEAEEKFAERGKILNYWAVMVNKKLKPGKEDDDDEDLDDEGKKKKKGPKGKGDLKVSGELTCKRKLFWDYLATFARHICVEFTQSFDPVNAACVKKVKRNTYLFRIP